MAASLELLSEFSPWWILIIGVVVIILLKRRGLIALEEARRLLSSGAVIVDVRSEQEFLGGRVDGAVNIPLDRVVEGVSAAYPDRSTVFLCHCAGGVRSANAVRQLRSAGYANSYNLGSYPRAKKLEV